uniref:Uncharacterized protein n=1 Tax=Strigamia maritima TaxID=126957 RepID=T1IYP6_STRMM
SLKCQLKGENLQQSGHKCTNSLAKGSLAFRVKPEKMLSRKKGQSLNPNELNSRKVRSITKYQRRDKVNAFKSDKSKKRFLRKFLWFLVISFSAISCSQQTYDRLTFFLSRPIETRVKLIRNSSVKFPSVTLCPYENNYFPLVNLRKLKAKERKLKHFCKVHFTTLLDGTLNISSIWDLMSLNGTLNTAFEFSINTSSFTHMSCVIVKLIRNSSVKFPSITLCPYENNYIPLVNLRKLKAKERKMKNFCKVRATALLDGTLNISTLWDLMSLNETLNTAFEFSKFKDSRLATGEKISNDAPLFSVKTDIKTTYGTCNTYSYENIVPFQKDDFKLIFTFHSYKLYCKRILTWFMIHNDDDIVTYKAARESKQLYRKSKAVYGLFAQRVNRIYFELYVTGLPMTSLNEVPLCANEKDAFDANNQLIYFNGVFNYLEKCKCPKICDDILYTEHLKMIAISDSSNPDTTLSVYFDDNLIEEIEEHYSYRFISFVCDVGGNFGLYLGLSILTAFQIGESVIVYTFETIRSKLKKIKPPQLVTTFENVNPIQKKKYVIYRNAKRSVFCNRCNCKIDEFKKSFAYKSLQFLLISSCALACSYQTYDRLNFFLSGPSETKVSLIRNSSVKFPSTTLCPDIGNYERLVEKRKQKAKERKLKHFCDVHPFALLDDTRNISTIWDLMFLAELRTIEHSRLKKLRFLSGEDVMQDPSLFTVKTDTRTMLGTCKTYSYENLVNFQKDDFMLVFMIHDFQRCNEISKSLFTIHDDNDIVTYKPANEFDVIALRMVTYGFSAKRFQQLISQTKTQNEFKILNRTKTPCDTNRVVNECEKNCFENYLKNIIRCRLPSTSLSELPLCANGEEALVAYNQLRLLSVSFNYLEQCKCPKICDEMIYTDRLKMTDCRPTDQRWIERATRLGYVTSLTFYFDDDVIEEIEEHYYIINNFLLNTK